MMMQTPAFLLWGDLNETYLVWLSDAEKKQYFHLFVKFAVIHEHAKNGEVPSLHGEVESFQKQIDQEVKEYEPQT